jgi:hypothetical protein
LTTRIECSRTSPESDELSPNHHSANCNAVGSIRTTIFSRSLCQGQRPRLASRTSPSSLWENASRKPLETDFLRHSF